MKSQEKEIYKTMLRKFNIISFIGGSLFGIIIALICVLVVYKTINTTQYPNTPVVDVDVNSLIHVNNKQDVNMIRKDLIHYIWGEEGFSEKLPDDIESDISDDRYSRMSNLKSIDRITINSLNGINSIVYLFHPKDSVNRLIIYHQGHEGDFSHGKNTIQFFLNHGYSVLAFSMPLMGMNSQPIIEIPGIGPLKMSSHDRLKFLDSPFQYFLDPISIALNYIQKTYDFDLVGMIGISGGGWTTTLYAAVDPRVTHTYPVAGTLPIFLRGNGNDWGDFEQNNPELYEIANYLDLYILGAVNGEQLQILNKYDPCCFGGERHFAYEKVVQEKSKLVGGTFLVFLDDTHKEHIISNTALKFIIDKLGISQNHDNIN